MSSPTAAPASNGVVSPSQVARWSIDAAGRLLGVSRPAIKRRLKNGSLRGVQKKTPRGFTWYVLVAESPDAESRGDSPESPARRPGGGGFESPLGGRPGGAPSGGESARAARPAAGAGGGRRPAPPALAPAPAPGAGQGYGPRPPPARRGTRPPGILVARDPGAGGPEAGDRRRCAMAAPEPAEPAAQAARAARLARLNARLTAALDRLDALQCGPADAERRRVWAEIDALREAVVPLLPWGGGGLTPPR
jgi:hypothetical protein